MYDEYVHLYCLCQFHQALLEDVMQTRVGSSSATEQADGVRIGILPLQVVCPHFGDIVAEELSRVMAGANGQVAGVRAYVIDALRYDDICFFGIYL